MLINLRNALMAGKRLPYDAEVEYLESSGTQYINTGVVPTTTKTQITFSTPTPPSSGYMCGSFNANNNRYYPAAFLGAATRYINLINAANTVISQHANDGNVHTVVYNATGGDCYFDGAAAGTLDTTTLTASNPIYLFGTSTETGVSGRVSGRIYSCKIWQNGVLVRDFIPVRRGTVGYLYDRVSGKLFGNAGTGDFVLGPDVVPVEYIESHGTEWIDTGFNITNATSFSYDVKFSLAPTITNSEPRVFSNEGAGSGAYYDIYFGTSENRLYMRQSGTSVQIARRDVPIVATMDEYGVYSGYYEDTPQIPLYETTRAFVAPTIDRDYRIFSRGNNTNSSYLWQGKLYRLNFSKNGTQHRKFHPVRVGSGSTWEGAMIDTLTRRIYRNAGTGAFGYGNDLKYPIPAA